MFITIYFTDLYLSVFKFNFTPYNCAFEYQISLRITKYIFGHRNCMHYIGFSLDEITLYKHVLNNNKKHQ